MCSRDCVSDIRGRCDPRPKPAADTEVAGAGFPTLSKEDIDDIISKAVTAAITAVKTELSKHFDEKLQPLKSIIDEVADETREIQEANLNIRVELKTVNS